MFFWQVFLYACHYVPTQQQVAIELDVSMIKEKNPDKKNKYRA